MDIVRDRIAVPDLQRLSHPHTDNPGSIDTSALIDSHRCFRNCCPGKSALQVNERIAKTSVGILQDSFLQSTISARGFPATRIDTHADHGISR